MNCRELDCDLTFVTLEFEDGESEECFVAGLYEIEGKKYLSVLLGVTEETDFESDDLEGYIYEYVAVNEDEFELNDIDNDEEFAKIADIIEAYEEAQAEE